MITTQDVVHKFEVGGSGKVRLAMILLALALTSVGYNWFSYRNMATQEAMDSAQLARNISEGKGFSTQFIRPYSIALVKKQRFSKVGTADDLALLKGDHPDISNPPLYPLMLAGFMKVLPFRYDIPRTPSGIWGGDGVKFRHQPDMLISLINQMIFLVCIYIVYRLGKRLFDELAAYFCALIMLGTEVFWKFSVTGLSTMLLMLLFLGVVWMIVLVEEEGREPKHGPGRLLVYAALAGLFVGLCGMTRYSFLWLILPVTAFLAAWGGNRRWISCCVAIAVFLGVSTPWMARNFMVSGLPFGTATYTVVDNAQASSKYIEYRLQRSLEPNPEFSPGVILAKLVRHLRGVVSNDVPKFAGNWVAGLFLLALMMNFRSPAISRLRIFMAGALAFMMLIQALGKTQLSEDMPEFNSENLLVVLAPLVILFGVAMFFTLLDAIELPIPELRNVILVCFGLLLCLPMLLTLLPPRATYPLVYPPYYPPQFQAASTYTKTNELTMCDLPWAMAWYGHRQCVWAPAYGHSDFFTIHDTLKPVDSLLLTKQLVDGRIWSQMLEGPERSFGTMMFNLLATPPDSSDPKWPKVVTLAIARVDGVRSYLPFGWMQDGWHEFLLLTTRKVPVL
ncbi:MAG: glycosyltransferase family 39 protein [Verrucomicrobia bacterium]|nr:glycosyltransferase family 39 protein [Verrucomicrobiota bacterium]